MKKGKRRNRINPFATIIITLILIVVFFLIYFLQTNIFSSLPIAGIFPNLYVMFILFIGLYGNSGIAIFLGIFAGLWIDSIYGVKLGITSASLMAVGFIASWFDSLWSKDEKISIIIMVAVSTLVFECLNYFLNVAIFNFGFEMWPFFKILAIEILYNVILTIIFFVPIKKIGYKMERKLKRNNMYTVEL